MGIRILHPFAILLLLCCYKGSLCQRLKVSETDSRSVFVELLRGRDGLPGRDAPTGPIGPVGPQGETGPPGLQSGGATYIRWGKSSCPPATGTEMVYTGIAGGTHFTNTGGGSNYLCLPKDPEYSSTLIYRPGVDDIVATIHGVEYEFPLQGSHNHNAPCAVCRVSRPTVIMIPAKASCPRSWTREYYGYLMAEYNGHHRSTFVCVDEDQESIPDSHANTDGALFYHVQASCSSLLPCPPYNTHQEVNCVVCTK